MATKRPKTQALVIDVNMLGFFLVYILIHFHYLFKFLDIVSKRTFDVVLFLKWML